MTGLLFSSLVSAQADPEFIYFILVDRFNNGDHKNDPDIDLDDPHAFHGGDLSGITQKLDHIHNLGADTLWLSPIFTMRKDPFMGHGAFHGYWVQNLDSIEAAFGGQDDMSTLIAATKNHQMTVLIDMVYNHVSFDSEMLKAHPDWFHPAVSIQDWNDPYELRNLQVHGLPDFDQSRPPVYQYFLHRSIYWKETLGIRGYRIDAVRHLDPSFLTQLTTDLHQENGQDFWMLGEDFQGNPVALSERAKETGLDALFDFPLYYAIIDTFCNNGPPSRLASLLWMDKYYPQDFQLVTFLDNHDLPRIMSACHQDPSKVLMALAFQMSIRGIPMLTYGTEALLVGENEPSNRADMPWQSDLLAEDWIRQLYALRKESPALKSGSGHSIYLDDNHWIYTTSSETQSAFLILNMSDSEFIIPKGMITSPKEAWRIEDKVHILNQIPQTVPSNSMVVVISNKEVLSSREQTIVLKHPIINGQLAMVGSDPIIGGWDPKKAPLFVREGDELSLTLTLSQYASLSYKLVQMVDGKSIWENGENRYLWVNKDKAQHLSKIRL